MIKSMTGFGRAAENIDGMEVSTEIKSVNHRYFEFVCRLPRQFAFLEEKIKKFVNTAVSRGKVEVYITINMLERAAVSVEVNHPLAKAYVDALSQLSEIYSLKNKTTANEIAGYPEVLSVKKSEEDEQAIETAVKSVLGTALKAFIDMREREGLKLQVDITERCDGILSMIETIEQNAEASVIAYRERLEEKIKELLDGVQTDEQRLLTETAILADKIAVDEETVRLRSHIDELKNMMEQGQAVGRKIDFLVQEMNRETNTIGSKSIDVEITKIVVEIKSQIEKIREQIQNIE